MESGSQKNQGMKGTLSDPPPTGSWYKWDFAQKSNRIHGYVLSIEALVLVSHVDCNPIIMDIVLQSNFSKVNSKQW
jgi:hypothetical protein